MAQTKTKEIFRVTLNNSGVQTEQQKTVELNVVNGDLLVDKKDVDAGVFSRTNF